MTENVILPPSIVAQINEARELAAQGNPTDASAFVAKAVADLASKDPGACAMVILAQSGRTEYTCTEQIRDTVEEKVSRTFFKIDLGTAIRPLKSNRVIEKHYTVK